jgi:hypothetical protein
MGKLRVCVVGDVIHESRNKDSVTMQCEDDVDGSALHYFHPGRGVGVA